MDTLIIKDELVLYDYIIYHRTVMLRSSLPCDNRVKSNIPINIDLIFSGVYYLEIEPYFHGDVVISDANSFDKERIFSKVFGSDYKEQWEFKKLFLLKNNEKSYFIGASNFQVEENNKPHYETGLEYMIPATEPSIEEYLDIMRKRQP